MSRLIPALAMACCILGLAACGTTGTPLPSPSASPSAQRTPLASPVVAGLFTPSPGSIYFGAYVNTSGLIGGGTPADTADMEAQLGRLLTLHMEYLIFSGSLSGNRLLDDFVHYRVPVVSWNCQYPDAEIANHMHDAQIQLAAQQAKNFGAPMFLRYFWDPNLPVSATAGSGVSRSSCWDPNQGDSPDGTFSASQYVAAWQVIHSIFVAAGATNVIWLWSVNADPSAAPPMAYYPGDSNVDWVGMDAYDTSNGSFASTFTSLYSTLSAKNKPVMISETGAIGAQQPAFFSAAVPTLKSQFPMVKAFLYFDGISYVATQNEDWRVAPSAFTSFQALANDPYMAASYVP